MDGVDQIFGITTYPRSWTPFAQILIDPAYCWSEKKHKSDNIFLSTCSCLLHEMCHAFLGLYGCERTNNPDDADWCIGADDNDSPCKLHRNDNNGAHGHGRAWHTLAKAVQDRSAALLGTRLKLFGIPDAKLEIKGELADGDSDADRWFPSKCDLDTFFSKADAAALRKIIATKQKAMKAAASRKKKIKGEMKARVPKGKKSGFVSTSSTLGLQGTSEGRVVEKRGRPRKM
jgi:hypothetical protein